MGADTGDGKNGVDSGYVRIYRMDDAQSNWIQIGDDIDGDEADDNSGWSVSLSVDGSKVAIGAPYNDANGNSAGHVRVFALE